MRRLLSLGVLGALAACQTGYVTYQRIGPGPDLTVAQAECNIGAMGVNQGYIAVGSPSYVAMAGLDNAIANSMRQEYFMQNCLITKGWQTVKLAQVPKGATVVGNQVIMPNAANVARQKELANRSDFPPAPGKR